MDDKDLVDWVYNRLMMHGDPPNSSYMNNIKGGFVVSVNVQKPKEHAPFNVLRYEVGTFE